MIITTDEDSKYIEEERDEAVTNIKNATTTQEEVDAIKKFLGL